MAEMISKKLALLKKLTEHLEGIGPAWHPDCPYEMTGNVYRGRATFGDDTKAPFIALLEAPRQLQPVGGGSGKLMQDEDWGILIQGFVKDDKTHPLDPAYDLLAWTQMRLSRITVEKENGGSGGEYPAEWRLGGLTGEIRYQLPIVRPGKDDVSATAYFYLPVSIGTITDLTNPFVQGD